MLSQSIDDYISGAVSVLVIIGLLHSFRAPYSAYNRLLQVFLILPLVHVVNGAIVSAGFHGILIHWFKIPYVVNAITVSVAFLYLDKLLNKETNWSNKDWYYTVPPFLVLLVMIPFYMLPSEVKRGIWSGLRNHGVFESHESLAAVIIVLTIMVFQTRQIVALHRFRNGAYWSSNALQSEEILKWIQYVNFLIGVLSVLSIGYVVLRAQGEVHVINGLFHLIYYGTNLALFLYIAIHPKIFKGLPAQHIPKAIAMAAPLVNLSETIQESKIYLDPDLSLYRLALNLGMAPPILSHTIRDQSSLNFNSFINKHRVAHCKKLMLEGELERHTIEALGTKSGFASRASFYRAFQQFEKCSPMEWLANQRPK